MAVMPMSGIAYFEAQRTESARSNRPPAPDLPDWTNPTNAKGRTDEEKRRMIEDLRENGVTLGYWIDGEMVYVNGRMRGTRDITDEQIDDILGRYDVGRLTRDDKDKLLAELIALDIVPASVFNRTYEQFRIDRRDRIPGAPHFDDIVDFGDWIEYFQRERERIANLPDMPIYANGVRVPPPDRMQQTRDYDKLIDTMRRIQARAMAAG